MCQNFLINKINIIKKNAKGKKKSKKDAKNVRKAEVFKNFTFSEQVLTYLKTWHETCYIHSEGKL